MRFLLSVLILVPVVLSSRVRYDGHEVWKLIPRTRVQLDFLKDLHQHARKNQLDFWKEPSTAQRPVIVRVPPNKREEIQLRVRLMGFIPQVSISNLQSLIDKEELTNARQPPPGFQAFDYGKYHPLDEINAWMQDMATTYPNRVVLFNVSTSYEGRAMTAMKIIGKNNDTKPGFWFNGGIHAREWISPATVIYMTSQLLEQYNKDPGITAVVDAFQWYILPVFNVDGYEYTWTKDRMWRKTRSKHFICYGVDPNRNWDWEWCKRGASRDPCSDTYCGPSAFSESEVKGVADYLSAVAGRFSAYIDFHSFSQLWMTPWGYTETLPPDFAIQDKCSTAAVDALTAVYGTQYQHGSIANTIYVASGSSADWTYGAAKIKYSTAVELRDTGEYGFVLPADQILPSGQETLKALLAMGKFISNNP